MDSDGGSEACSEGDGESAGRLRVLGHHLAAAAMPTMLSELRTPAYAMELSVVKANADRMLATAERLGCRLRPHVKTHKTVECALIQTGGRRRGIVVSTLAEAFFFADGGFDDILYAVPITPDKFKDAMALTGRLEQFHVLVDHPSTVEALRRAHPGPGSRPWSVFVMVDCGYHRDGVDPADPTAVTMVKELDGLDCATFAGIYTHGGHSYGGSNAAEIQRISAIERDAVVGFAEKLRQAGVKVNTTGIGSTPTCSVPPAHLDGINEMHPGNYVVYDVMQRDIGACQTQDIAARVLTRIIGHYPKQNMLLIDLGWTGCSAQGKEAGYGEFLGNPELKIGVLKQEAGEVESADGAPLDFSRYPIGSMLQLLPYHSCAATHQHRKINVVDNGRITAQWNICKGW